MSRSLYITRMAGFFPGANSTEALWKNLLSAETAPITKLDRYWGLEANSYDSPLADGHISMDSGHLADYPFVASSFPRQIQAAIDVGKAVLQNLEHRNIGLVVATEWTDPSFYQAKLGLIPRAAGYSAERQLETIKEELGILGPALAIDTACASSLYGLDLARGLLHSSHLEGVLVLGLNLYLHSFLYRGFTKLGALSKTQKLRSFDKNADGIVPGEAACGVFVSSSAAGAIAEVCGIGLSSDGNEGSAFSPGLEGQISAYTRAYQDAEIDPALIDYVEAHGTATILGDQTEVEGLRRFFRRPLIVGSSKANVGHTLAASGLVAVIKAALMIKHRTLTPHMKFRTHPDHVKKGITHIPTAVTLSKDTIHIGVSSFGFGGSNAHLIIRTPQQKREAVHLPHKLFLRGLEVRNGQEMSFAPPVLKDVAMGPKLQERLDPLQRWTVAATQRLLARTTAKERESFTCVFLNNLGGNLSLAFERKYRLGAPGPELSIEAIASTLPSMLSGNAALMFNFRGHHLLVSGPERTMETLFALTPYLLKTAAGDIILGLIQNESHILLLHLSLNGTQATGELTLTPSSRQEHPTPVEALIGLFRHSEKADLNLGDLCLSFSPLATSATNDSSIRNRILQASSENKQMALEYLKLLEFLKPGVLKSENFGHFLQNCEKRTSHASGSLVVDETHPYFFDHPLDHVPGILTIHGCEELLAYYIGDDYLVSSLTIRFTRFIEKNQPIKLTLIERESGNIDFDVWQGNKKAGTLKAVIQLGPVLEEIGPRPMTAKVEDKKWTHKHKDENVLISALDEELEIVSSLPLGVNRRGEFFAKFTRPSSLYFAEVTRQFVMLLAHQRKGIPLATKMNLIATEIHLSAWIRPPFHLRLKEFNLTETEDFLVADVTIEFVNDDRVFGGGRIKAQVVSAEYYAGQRGEA